MKAFHAYKIRNAGFEDAGAIYALIKEHPREVVPRAISDIVQNIDRFLVCEAKGRRKVARRIIGTAAWQILPEIGKARNPSIEIKSVAVQNRYRRRGIGSALVKATIQRIKRFHPAQIVVLTFTTAFFRRFGFHEVPKETLMHKLYMGCINCTKYDSPFTCPEVAMTLVVKPRPAGAG
ncbi:MAG: GNAT family N-acetyltransferase [Lentisphaerae bacterium]|nr:GNAT family N-acetyltransferase [Lentisphaerota bacterium]